jgi:DNA recombination protein RmuC
MNELITKIQGDSTLMLMAIIAVVVLLVIVLTVVVSAMRVKTYKDRFWNVQVDNKEKAEYIVKIERELQEYKIKDAKNQQELAQFSETKTTLKETEENFKTLQKSANELEKVLSQTKAKLESAEGIYENHMQEHMILKERFDAVMEKNAKYRVNNARLLMKLESEGRQTQMMREKQNAQGKNDA